MNKCKYKKVQFIGHSINTGPRWINGKKFYIGNAEDPVADICDRVSFIKYILSKVLDNNQVDDAKDVLKVLVLPEFFFRGKIGAYEMRDVDNLRVKLQHLISDSKWEHWIFFFGTILGKSERKNPNGSEIYNFCLIQQGGFEKDKDQCDNLARVVMKEKRSGIDFIEENNKGENSALTSERVRHLVPLRDFGVGREQQQHHFDGLGIFQISGITFGVEICLDHHNEVRRLKRSPQARGQQKVQIQIVPSCGMSIKTDSVVAMKDGWIFNCDGLNNCITDLRQVQVLGLSNPINYQIINLNFNVNNLFSCDSGELHIYDPKNIPEPEIV